MLVGLPATFLKLRPKLFTICDHAALSIPSRSNIAGASAGVEPRLPATVLRANQSRIISNRIKVEFVGFDGKPQLLPVHVSLDFSFRAKRPPPPSDFGIVPSLSARRLEASVSSFGY
jgi:hypothetical protein